MMHRRRLLAAVSLSIPWAGPALALDAPRGAVLLSVTGNLRFANADARAVFDLAMIKGLPQSSYATSTPWFTKPRQFTGPLLRDVLAAAGAKGTALKASALNNYQVNIPMDDLQRHDVLLAHLLDGKPMLVREKGPLLIIYPFDRDPNLRNAVYYSRCAWQLTGIEVL